MVWAWFNVLYMALVSPLEVGCDWYVSHVQRKFMHNLYMLQQLHVHALAPILFLTYVLDFGTSPWLCTSTTLLVMRH